MDEKIYVISCSQDLMAMGIDRIRKAVEGLEETVVSLDWSKVRLVPVVADEKNTFKVEETKILSIKPITIPKNAIVIQSFFGTNGMGHISCIGSAEFKTFDQVRTADKAMFQSRIKASVMNGDLLGQVLVVQSKK
ncbi:MAG: DUF22 domain-containing protein [Candidatus Thorarchaeota archaeon]|jgi:hypothetical protein